MGTGGDIRPRRTTVREDFSFGDSTFGRRNTGVPTVTSGIPTVTSLFDFGVYECQIKRRYQVKRNHLFEETPKPKEDTEFESLFSTSVVYPRKNVTYPLTSTSLTRRRVEGER